MSALQTLRKGEQFDRAYRIGTVVSGPLFILRISPNQDDGPRWGFAVGRRLSKHAVVRNRIRRRFREAARVIGARGGYDVVVIAKAPVLGARYGEILRQLRRSLERGGVLEELPA